MTCIFHCLFSIVLLFNVSACQSKNKVEKANEKFEERIVAEAEFAHKSIKNSVKFIHKSPKKEFPKKKSQLIPEFKSRGFRWLRMKEDGIDFL
ncbi:hypothetical protein FIU87_07730 [Bacillus sp. THAF10]|uniref:hypothetical protein n=1 Tax=Bacillus sp. THAF10 TaxID=2587848 RepID=UPI0012683C29|nr:hypothetical protein [Bacillus sp. THAF10]QFT88527.1 hypothetical protein FIU87_07730 [Bacillus sp. THAF10]